MTRPTCKDCRYWYCDDDTMGVTSSHLRECRRQPPTYYADVNRLPADDNDLFGHWPVTFDDNWCGEHKPSKAELKTAPTVQELATRDTTHYGDQAKQKLWEDIGNTGHYSEWQEEPQT